MTRNANENRKEKTREPNAPAYIAYAVTDKGNGKSIWTRIGAAWAHEDGNGFSLSQLNLVPTERRTHRPADPLRGNRGERRVSAFRRFANETLHREIRGASPL